jgi:hypothetical protein
MMLADLIIATGVLLLAAATSYHIRALRQLRGEVGRERNERLRLEGDFEALLACSRTLGTRFQQQSELQQSLTVQIRNLSRQPTDSEATLDAQRLLSEGLRIDQVATLCELSQGEAALLSTWRQRQHAA